MTGEFHITFGTDETIWEADVEVTATRDGRAWDFQRFRFEEVVETDPINDYTKFHDYMPEEVIELAENEAEREFLKAYNGLAQVSAFGR